MTSPLAVLAARGVLLDMRSRCGVYLLLSGDDIVYVGQSQNSVGRIAAHVREFAGQFDRCLFIDTAPDQRLPYERALIRAFLPKLNAKIPAHRASDAASLRALGVDPAILDHAAIQRRRAPELKSRGAKARAMWRDPAFRSRRARSRAVAA